MGRRFRQELCGKQGQRQAPVSTYRETLHPIVGRTWVAVAFGFSRLKCYNHKRTLCMITHVMCKPVPLGGATTYLEDHMTENTDTVGQPTRSHRDYYMALTQVALTVSSSLELDAVLQSVVISVTEAMLVKACVLRLLNPQTGRLRLSAVHGLSSSYLAKGPVDVE